MLLVQGVLTRRGAMKLPEAAGAREGITEEGATKEGATKTTGDGGLVVVLGDSVVAGVGVETTSEAMPARLVENLSEFSGQPMRWRAMGANGHRLEDVLQLLPQLKFLDQKPELLIINVGVNDVSGLPR